MSSDVTESHGVYIDGAFQDGEGVFEVEDPSTGEAFASVAEAGQRGVDAAIDSAREAQQEWIALAPSERGRILRDFADAIREHADELATVITRENGRPIGQSKGMMQSTPGYLEYYAGATDKIEGETIPVPGGQHAFTRREPLGVSAQILPWNAPVLLTARGVAPALAAGNAVVVKPAPEAPLGITRMAELGTEAGLPPGLFNVVPGGAETGEALATSDRVDEITFTGSVATGKIVGKAAVENVLPMALELGGKSPAVIFDDADLDDALGGALQAISFISGQVCFATTRIFVQSDVYEEFREMLLDAVEAMEIGPGADNPDIGPLISGDGLAKVERYVSEAVNNGSEASVGGQALDRDGYFFEPTVIEGAGDRDAISCEEVFGPVVNLYEFESESEAIRRANDTEYGLYATVWTNTLDRAHRVANAIEAGSVMVNQYAGSYPQTPFGGYKNSGIGREKGFQAIDHYTQLKTINIDIGGEGGGAYDG